MADVNFWLWGPTLLEYNITTRAATSLESWIHSQYTPPRDIVCSRLGSFWVKSFRLNLNSRHSKWLRWYNEDGTSEALQIRRVNAIVVTRDVVHVQWEAGTWDWQRELMESELGEYYKQLTCEVNAVTMTEDRHQQ